MAGFVLLSWLFLALTSLFAATKQVYRLFHFNYITNHPLFRHDIAVVSKPVLPSFIQLQNVSSSQPVSVIALGYT